MKNKWTLVLCAGLLVIGIVTSLYAATWIKQTGLGLFIGTRTTDPVGFYGVDPTEQQTAVVPAATQAALTIQRGAAASVAGQTAAAATLTPITAAAAGVTYQRAAVATLTPLTMDLTYTDGSTNVQTVTIVTGVTFSASADAVTNFVLTAVDAVTGITFSAVNAVTGITSSAASPVTNVTINTVYGFGSAAQATNAYTVLHKIGITD